MARKTKFITNEPLPVGFGYNIRYNHNKGGPDFRRVDANQVMLLSSHDHSLEKVLGTVKNATHTDTDSNAEIELLDIEDDPAIKRANALLENGAKGISAGILVHDAHVDGKTLEVDKWELVELSLTPIPRDYATDIEGNSISSPFFIANDGGAQGLIERYFKNLSLIHI